jgi:hypothetical protein
MVTNSTQGNENLPTEQHLLSSRDNHFDRSGRRMSNSNNLRVSTLGEDPPIKIEFNTLGTNSLQLTGALRKSLDPTKTSLNGGETNTRPASDRSQRKNGGKIKE